MEYSLIGNHETIRKIRELVTMVSDTAFNVLLLGETGTGKEVVSRLLYNTSSRRGKRFIKVNCAALPLSLLESELFGYEKGAFTGADRRKPGKFELASEGAIFLDEIGDMPVVLQVKLLQVLQSGEFNRLGGTADVKVNAWVIASTNHDLEDDMKKGVFREDLYYRLNVIKIELPPLRERIEDIGVLTEHFIKKHESTIKLGKKFSLNSRMKDFFEAYLWPGNVRELSSTILRLMVGEEPRIIERELTNNMEVEGASPQSGGLNSDEYSDNIEHASKQPKSKAYNSLKNLKSEATSFIEKSAILHALDLAGGNKREAAKILKISYKALFYKMNNLGISLG